MQAASFLQRQKQHTSIAKADHLRTDHASASGPNFTEVAHRNGGTVGGHHQAHQFADASRMLHGRNPGQRVKVTLQDHERLIRSVNPRSISLNWVPIEASNSPREVSKTTLPVVSDASAAISRLAGRSR